MSNELQHRLYHYEVAPPDATWDKIVSELDDSHLSSRILTKTVCFCHFVNHMGLFRSIRFNCVMWFGNIYVDPRFFESKKFEFITIKRIQSSFR